MNAPFNRYLGLIVLEVIMSNPNGDPDMESEPRTRDIDGLGMISPVSVKRKFRDLIGEKSPVFQEAKKKLNLGEKTGNLFDILESRGRKREEIIKLNKTDFIKRYWDARVFGNTFLESLKDKDLSKEELERKKEGGYHHLINTGALQIGVGLSVAPIDVVRMTTTNKAGVEADKDRGMAPLSFRVVQHAIYYIPFFLNPSVAKKTGATKEDIDLFKFTLPYIYDHTSSTIRTQISILHAWLAEHKNVLGSCPEYLFLNKLKPTVKSGINKPMTLEDYHIPQIEDLGDIQNRFNEIVDLVS